MGANHPLDGLTHTESKFTSLVKILWETYLGNLLGRLLPSVFAPELAAADIMATKPTGSYCYQSITFGQCS